MKTKIKLPYQVMWLCLNELMRHNHNKNIDPMESSVVANGSEWYVYYPSQAQADEEYLIVTEDKNYMVDRDKAFKVAHNIKVKDILSFNIDVI